MDKKLLTPQEALLKMATLCARSEQAPCDIDRKLRLRGLSEKDRRRVLDELIERGFVNESRFAHSFANDKVKFASWGRLKIRNALAAKLIRKECVEKALADIPNDDYREALRRVAKSSARGLDLRIYEHKMKFLDRIARRGFEPELAIKVLKKVETLLNEKS